SFSYVSTCPAPAPIDSLSLHDALPICLQVGIANLGNSLAAVKKLVFDQGAIGQQQLAAALADDFDGLTHEQLRQRLINGAPKYRSEEHTSELQSRENLVCRLLLEKKKA